jgi:glutaredoxin
MSMTLYHVHWCPECEVVRHKLAELRLSYKDVVVPDLRPQRKEVFAVSGQYYVPRPPGRRRRVERERTPFSPHLESKAEAGRPANG